MRGSERVGGIAFHLAGVALAIFALEVGPAAAAQLRGKVTAVTGGTVRIEVEGDLVPQVGDRVGLSFRIPGGPEIPVGEWRVSKVSAAGVEATVHQASGTPTVGQVATIESAHPTRRTAATLQDPAAGASGTGKAVPTLLVEQGTPSSGRLADGQGSYQFDGKVLGVRSSPSVDGWLRLSREPAQSYRVTAGLLVRRGSRGRSAGRSAGVLLSRHVGGGELDEGDIYAGLVNNGVDFEVHRYERGAWRLVGSSDLTRLGAPDDLVIERVNDRYSVQLNGVMIANIDAIPGRPDWLHFLVAKGVEAELSAWKVERLP